MLSHPHTSDKSNWLMQFYTHVLRLVYLNLTTRILLTWRRCVSRCKDAFLMRRRRNTLQPLTYVRLVKNFVFCRLFGWDETECSTKENLVRNLMARCRRSALWDAARRGPAVFDEERWWGRVRIPAGWYSLWVFLRLSGFLQKSKHIFG